MSARDDYHPNEWDKGNMIEAMWEEIDRLRVDNAYLEDIARTRGEENERLRVDREAFLAGLRELRGVARGSTG